jgi:hypothetical protein
MANYNKQFNFRNGVQVDNDNLVVSPTGLVGIGTTVPVESLDVRGNASVTGFATANALYSSILDTDTATIGDIVLEDSIIGSGVSIRSGVVTATGSGIVTYYGDARFLQGLPTSQWIDIDVGLGYTSIYAQGNVGIATDDPRFTFQIGGTSDNTEAGFKGNSLGGVGISSGGDVLITGITTSGTFVGIGSDVRDLDASKVTYGTLNVERLPLIPDEKLYPNQNLGVVTTTSLDTGAITGSNADLTGDVVIGAGLTVANEIVGTASTARGLTGSPDIVVGILTANAVSSSSFIGGITGDVTGNLTGNVTGNVVGILTGDVTGTATTATALTSTADVDIADLQVGLVTVTNRATVENFVAIGTDFSDNGGLTVRESAASRIQVISDSDEAVIAIGRSTLIGGYNGAIRFGNTSGLNPYSSEYAFDLINYGKGNFNYYLQAGEVGVGTGNFFWHYKTSEQLMTLTYEGRLGIGVTEPTEQLEVFGGIKGTSLEMSNGGSITGDLNVTSVVSAGTSIGAPTVFVNLGRDGLVDSTGTSLFASSNVDISSGVSTFHDIEVGGNLQVDASFGSGGGVRIGSIDPAEIEAPLAPLQVGNGSASPDETVVIEEGAVGIGTTVIGEDNSLNCYSGTGVFRRVGVGTDDLDGLNGTLHVKGGLVVEPSDLEPGNPVLSVTGIVTATDGFSSDGTGPVQITVVGNSLTFTVGGLSTSLTLS